MSFNAVFVSGGSTLFLSASRKISLAATISVEFDKSLSTSCLKNPEFSFNPVVFNLSASIICVVSGVVLTGSVVVFIVSTTAFCTGVESNLP